MGVYEKGKTYTLRKGYNTVNNYDLTLAEIPRNGWGAVFEKPDEIEWE